MRSLDEVGEVFVGCAKDQMVWLENPEPRVPPRKSPRGRAPEKLESRMPPIRVDLLAAQAPPSNWQRLTVRETAKGKCRRHISSESMALGWRRAFDMSGI